MSGTRRQHTAQIRLASGTRARADRAALTLAELLMVLAILAVVATLVLPAVGHYMSDSREVVTRQSLTRLRDTVAGTYWPDMQAIPRISDLFVNPNTGDATLIYDPVYRRGWRGPYLVHGQGAVYTIVPAARFSNTYGENGDPAVPDGWGRPIVIQQPGTLADGRLDVRIVSAGADGVLSIPPETLTADLTATAIGDDQWVSFEVRP